MLACIAASGLLFSANAYTDEQEVYDIDLPAQSVAESLIELSEQIDILLLFPSEIAKKLEANPVRGRYTLPQALEIMLDGTGYSGGLSKTGVLMISLTKPDATENGEKAMKSTAQAKSKSTKKASVWATIAGFLATVGAAPNVSAQEELDNDEVKVLEEIVVTASKRTQSLQDVAFSISALSNEDIERRGLVGMSDYLRTIPGVSQIDRGVGRDAIVMRGISAAPQTDQLGATVGVYLGEIPLTGYTHNQGNADIKLIDIERIEVLRGPQGTLYGSSSLGGTVRNIPVAPNLLELEGRLKAGYSNTAKRGGDNPRVEGVINIPLVKGELGIRAVGYRFENDGYVENIAASDPAFSTAAAAFGVSQLAIDENHIGTDEYIGGRISVLWQPNDVFQASLMYLKQDLEQDGFPSVQLALRDYQQTRYQMDATAGGVTIRGGEVLKDDIDIVNLDLEYDLGWGTILSSTSWVDEFSVQNRDLAAFFGGLPLPQADNTETESLIEEIRFSSRFDSPFQVVMGLFYQDIQRDRFNALLALNPPPLTGYSLLIHIPEETTKTDQIAVFGELSYQITEQITLTGGVRYFDYDREFSTEFPAPVAIESGEADPIFKANVTYTPNDDALLYAQWSEGFRLGTPLRDTPAATCDLNNDGLVDGADLPLSGRQLDSDTLDSYELGSKLTFLNGALNINASIYRNDWKGIPITLIVPCGFGQNVNAGEARTQGFEVEAAYQVGDHLQLSVSGSYVDAELTEDAPGLGVDGDRLPGSPEYNVNVGLEYEFEVAGHASFARMDYARVGGFYNNLQETGAEAGDYDLLNLKAGINIDQFDVEVFVNNLTNANELTWVGTVFGANADSRAFRLRPRTFGFNVGYRF